MGVAEVRGWRGERQRRCPRWPLDDPDAVHPLVDGNLWGGGPVRTRPHDKSVETWSAVRSVLAEEVTVSLSLSLSLSLFLSQSSSSLHILLYK